MEDQPRPSNDIRDWLTLQARLTTFHPDGTPMPDIAEWWQHTFRTEPDRIESMPRERSVQVGGNLPDGYLTVSSIPGRTDFILEPANEQSINSDRDWPGLSVRSYHEVVGNMVTPVRHWLNTQTPVYRLAVGARLLAPSPDLDSVYRSLGKFLPGIHLEGISNPDFIFRINRQRHSTHEPTVLINRVAAWSTAQGQNVTIPVGHEHPNPSTIQFAAHLETGHQHSNRTK